MGEPLRKLEIDGGDFDRNNEDTFNLNDLLHPGQAFSHPADVDDLSPKLHPPMSRVLASFALRPFFGSPEAGVFRLIHDGGLAAPSRLSNVIGGFCPSAPWGRSSL